MEHPAPGQVEAVGQVVGIVDIAAGKLAAAAGAVDIAGTADWDLHSPLLADWVVREVGLECSEARIGREAGGLVRESCRLPVHFRGSFAVLLGKSHHFQPADCRPHVCRIRWVLG